MRRVLPLLVLLVPFLLAGPLPPAAAVVGGAPDGSAHPYVAQLIAAGASSPACSGVLVRNDLGDPVVLTDAHCLAAGPGGRGRGWSAVFDGVLTPASTRWAGTWFTSPAFDPRTYRHDLGVLVLDRVPSIAPAQLAAVGSAPSHGSLLAVGAGTPHAGQRRSASEVLTGLDPDFVRLRAGSGNTCTGDSGGPDLLPGSSTVVALTDQGSCSDDLDLRVDTTEVRQFLDAVDTAPVPAQQPANVTVNAGSSATFTATAGGADGVQWERSGDGGTTFADVPSATATSLVVVPTAADNGVQYRARFTGGPAVRDSGPAVLSVRAAAGAGQAGRHHVLLPARLLDTRTQRAPLQRGEDRPLHLAGTGGLPALGVGAVVLSVTVPQPQASGDLLVHPDGQLPASRTASLAWSRGRTSSALVLARLGGDGSVALSLEGLPADVIVDVLGWYGDDTDAGGDRTTPAAPQRLQDTPVTAGADLRVPVGAAPPGARSALLDMTVTGASAGLDAQVYPWGAAPAVRTSNLNVRPGQTSAVAVDAALGPDGAVGVSLSQGSARVVVDLVGWTGASGDRVVLTTPRRLLDHAPLAPGADATVTGEGDGVLAAVTALGAARPADVEAYPTGNPPTVRTSLLNPAPGVLSSSTALVPGRGLALSVEGSAVQVVVDLLGRLEP